MFVEVVVALTVILLSLRVYCSMTAGRCHSSRSMVGKTVIITGATAGIGKETARNLLRRGARVILACRNLEKAARVASELAEGVDGTGEVVVRRLDTSDLTSVRNFAKEVLETEKAIHVLVNNAGIAGPDKRTLTRDGLELTMATNHFGHFLLTNLLLDRIKKSAPSRIINVSSIAHIHAGEKELKDLAMSTKYRSMYAYPISKLCNVLFTRELADKLTGTAKDAKSGAQTTIFLAVSEEVEGVTGRYFSDCKEAKASDLVERKDLTANLWEASVKAVRLQQHEMHY